MGPGFVQQGGGRSEGDELGKKPCRSGLAVLAVSFRPNRPPAPPSRRGHCYQDQGIPRSSRAPMSFILSSTSLPRSKTVIRYPLQ